MGVCVIEVQNNEHFFFEYMRKPFYSERAFVLFVKLYLYFLKLCYISLNMPL